MELSIYKLMASDLKRAIPNDMSFKIKYKKEEVGLSHPEFSPSIEIDLSLVWLQGTITEISLISETNIKRFKLSDGTGEVIIEDYESKPGGRNPNIKKGSYVGVICQLKEISPHIVTIAKKVMDLSSNIHLNTIWPKEVQDLKGKLLQNS